MAERDVSSVIRTVPRAVTTLSAQLFAEADIPLPVILVRNQITDMLGRETGKITFGTIWRKFRTSSDKNSNLVHWEGADCKVVVKFMTVFSRGGMRPAVS